MTNLQLLTHITQGSPTDVRQMSYSDIQNIRRTSTGPPDIRTGGRLEVGKTLEDLPKSAPTDIPEDLTLPGFEPGSTGWNPSALLPLKKPLIRYRN
ncbi:hypothetical protein DAPPUDRAFT_248447 [Daphnia pulex]|uniref:Uncharacterized protein n=1 Tax=Daphnia pulex TaxID=6669 RepID=E9GUP1_DAPPU|nr:hypothetical protein DAPPUDRAFT_248447 [Daphnia pulex]|eukprot:EFX76766.1 hypothetical protein DAPPUDRAFT_248447 [Daphnia pulex]